MDGQFKIGFSHSAHGGKPSRLLRTREGSRGPMGAGRGAVRAGWGEYSLLQCQDGLLDEPLELAAHGCWSLLSWSKLWVCN